MPEVAAVRVSPTCSIPEMLGVPVGASLGLVIVTLMVWSVVFCGVPVPPVARTTPT